MKTTLYMIGDAEAATTLLGLARQMAMRIGLHRDPSHFMFSPWICEMRRRAWCHFMLLDNPFFNGEGFDSDHQNEESTSASSDGWKTSGPSRPTNADDDSWKAHRFAKPGSGPPDVEGFTDMTFVIIRRIMYGTTRSVARASCRGVPNEELFSMADEAESWIKARFFSQGNDRDAFQVVTLSYFRMMVQTLRLFLELKVRRRQQAQNAEQDTQ